MCGSDIALLPVCAAPEALRDPISLKFYLRRHATNARPKNPFCDPNLFSRFEKTLYSSLKRGKRLSDRLSSLLLIHDDSEQLDTLTCLFEARGFEVAIAASAFAARSRLELDREHDVIIAVWDTLNTTGGQVYQWVLDNRYDLRDRFVFLTADPPGNFDRVVRGRCLLLGAQDYDEILRVAESIALRARIGGSRASLFDMISSFDPAQPSLLLVEDEPLQLLVMRMVLAHVGFKVTTVDSGKAAMAELERADYDVILSDWYMSNGSGSDLYDWLVEHRPHLAVRCVFMSAANPIECAYRAPGCPFLHKGQDSPALFHQLKSIAGASPM